MRLDKFEKEYDKDSDRGFGAFKALADGLWLELTDRERRLGTLQTRLLNSVHPTELPDILTDFYGCVSGPVSHESARLWLQKQGYLPDETPRQPDSEATVGPIRDIGNPFEAGIPY
jgi:hypothetical protein